MRVPSARAILPVVLKERILTWAPKLAAGQYTVRARLIYDLNRYNDPQFTGDQTEIYRASLAIDIKD